MNYYMFGDLDRSLTMHTFFSRTCISTCFIKRKKSITINTVVNGLMTRQKGAKQKLQPTRQGLPWLVTHGLIHERGCGSRATGGMLLYHLFHVTKSVLEHYLSRTVSLIDSSSQTWGTYLSFLLGSKVASHG
jgi:hypothetical protein